jgi:hypothetical protein
MTTESSGEDRSQKLGGSSDQPADEDILGFGPYVQAVKRFLTSDATKPPITLSVEGEWGTGKSTFINLLSNSLEEDDHIIVEFNPWRHEHGHSLWAAFATTFLDTIRDQSPQWRQLFDDSMLAYRRFRRHANRFERIKLYLWVAGIIIVPILFGVWGSEFFPAVTNIKPNSNLFKILIGSSGSILAFLSLLQVWNHFKNPFLSTLYHNVREHSKSPDYEERISFIEKFHRDLKESLDTYLGTDQRVFVLIDDLDRCPVPMAAELMQSINLMIGQDSRVIFIIAMDRQRIAAGISSKYDDILPLLLDDDRVGDSTEKEDSRAQLEFGYNFIEKFVQVPFIVPTPTSEDIRDLISEDQSPSSLDIPEQFLSDEVFENVEEILDSELMETIAALLGFNPRQSIRFKNLFYLRVLLASADNELAINESDRGITFEQLAKFVAISLEYPQLITEVSRDETLLDDLETLADDSDSNLTEDRRSKLDYWTQQEKLTNLLAYGLDMGEEYSLNSAPLNTLVRISPRTDRPTESETEREEDSSFPWLDYRRSRWKVPCPNCGKQVHNSRSSFKQHWNNNRRCEPMSEEELAQRGLLKSDKESGQYKITSEFRHRT